MSFHFFPINYKPIYSLERTYAYISDYVNLLNTYIRQKFNATYIQPPIASNANGSWNTHKQNERYISFDNKYTNEVNELLNDPSNYMRYVLISFDNLNVPIFTSMTNIKRDVIEKNGEVMVSFNYYIEYHLMTEINHDTQNISLLKNILMMIDAINQNEKFKDVKFSKYIIEKINFISIFELKKKYPTLALKESLNRYVSTNGLTFINGVYERLPNDEHLLVGSPTSDDYHRSGILYVFNKITNSIIPIIKITTRPNQDLIQKQIILDIPNELEEQIYQNTVLNDQIHFLPSIGIQIYFSNLMLINLSKMHLCEVIHSPFSPELLKYFRENEIEVM
ncbi:MAG: hypothetical protein LBF36_01680 [Mycoplasmataceae bacterium]|nr:hypothetical protein [Mycoplasmataceae bacterium]